MRNRFCEKLVFVIAMIIAVVPAYGHSVAVDFAEVVVHLNRLEMHPQINEHVLGHTSIHPQAKDAANQYVRALTDSLLMYNEHGERLHVETTNLSISVPLDIDVRFVAMILRPSSPLAQQARQLKLAIYGSGAGSLRNSAVTLTSGGNVETIDLAVIRGQYVPAPLLTSNPFDQPLLLVEQVGDKCIVEWHIPLQIAQQLVAHLDVTGSAITSAQIDAAQENILKWMQDHVQFVGGDVVLEPTEARLTLMPQHAGRVADCVNPDPVCIFNARLGFQLTFTSGPTVTLIQLHRDVFTIASPSLDVVVIDGSLNVLRGTVTSMDRTVRFEDGTWSIGRGVTDVDSNDGLENVQDHVRESAAHTSIR